MLVMLSDVQGHALSHSLWMSHPRLFARKRSDVDAVSFPNFVHSNGTHGRTGYRCSNGNLAESVHSEQDCKPVARDLVFGSYDK